MTKTQRRHFSRTFALGAALTLLAILLDSTGVLKPLENAAYNLRALHCQIFAPKPTTQLIHVDVDDAALEEIGRWPWPRAELATLIDELRILGTRTIALDIIMPEPEAVEITQSADGTITRIDHDTLLAEAIKGHGRVLVPVSVTFGKPQSLSPQQKIAEEIFVKNLEKSPVEVAKEIRQQFGVNPSSDLVLNARRQTIARQVQATTLPADQLSQLLLPETFGQPDGRAIAKIIREEYDIRLSRQSELKLARTPMPAELAAIATILPTPKLAEAAAYTGFVDHISHDGVVRGVPLWVASDGILFPQMGLQLACAQLGVPIAKLRIREDAVEIPLPNREVIRLPITSQYSEKLGRSVRLMAVPWFGTRAWETMYDFPDHRSSAQHVPVTTLIRAAQARRQIEVNNRQADQAMGRLADALGLDDVKQFLAAPPSDRIWDSRFKTLQHVIKETDDSKYIVPLAEKKREDLDADERSLLDAYQALGVVLRGNQKIVNDEADLRKQFAGNAVLVGSTASGASDFVTTPLHAQCPGVVVHGAVFNAIMTGVFWTAVPPWMNVLATILMGLMTAGMVGYFSPKNALLGVVLLLAGYAAVNGYVVFDYGRHIMAVAAPMTAAVLVWVVVTVASQIADRKERERIKSRLGSYLDKQLLDYCMENPDLLYFAGQEKELTVVFTDMQGFTTLMERLGKQIVPVLTEYMGRMVPIIQANGGYVNKFLGDGIMFFYGAPQPNHDHAIDAVETLLQMRQGIKDFNLWLESQGLEPVAVRAGVTTGLMIVGDAGPERMSDYTVLGDTVNLASRLEGANKYLGTSVLISDRTAELLEGRYLLRPVGKVRVVGKTEAVMTYEPLATNESATQEQIASAKMSQEIFDAFVSGDFEGCLTKAKSGGDEKLFSLYAGLCERYLRQKPVGFEGVVELSEK